MIRRRSYLIQLNRIFSNANSLVTTKTYLRFRQVVYLSTSFFKYTFLVRKRLLKKKHLNQYIYFNTIFYQWVFFYLNLTTYLKKLTLLNTTTSTFQICSVSPLYSKLAPFFFYICNHPLFCRKITLLIPKYACATNTIKDNLQFLRKASPILPVMQKSVYPSALLFIKQQIFYTLQLDLLFSLYLIYLKEYYLTLQLLFKC